MLLTNILNQEDIDYVRQLVLEAGLLAPQLRASITIKEKTGPFDRVTTADLELSTIIVEGLHKRFKNDSIVSEEDVVHDPAIKPGRVWLVDPIDGTDHYISNDGEYAVMVGLLLDYKPVFGWIYAPATQRSYYGGPSYGAWRQDENEVTHRFPLLPAITDDSEVRLFMGSRDRRSHPWVDELPKITMVKSGGIGIKVVKVLENDADLFVHLSGKLKTWDTAGPVAIALGGQLEAGGMECAELSFPSDGYVHESTVLIGRSGSLAWCRSHLKNPDEK